MQIVLATHNRGKMEEMAAILGHLPVELITLDTFPEIGDIPETGNTLKENAFIKAETVHRLTGLPALADDTGLEVDALNGAPGIYSARYAGADATFDDNCQKMLKELHGIPVEKRTARFRTVIAFVNGGEVDSDRGFEVGVISCQWPCSVDHIFPSGAEPSGWGTFKNRCTSEGMGGMGVRLG